MTEAEFLTYLQTQVSMYQKNYGVSVGKAFMMWYAIEVIELSEEAAYESVSYDGGNDQSVDLFYIDEQSERVIIGQGKFQANGQYKSKRQELHSLLHTVDWLTDAEALKREGRRDLAEISKDYEEVISRGFSTEFFYVHTGPAKTDVTYAASVYNSSQRKKNQDKSCRVLNLGALKDLHEEHIDAGSRITSELIPLTKGQYFEQEGAYGKALVATLSGTVLHELYGKYEDRLFDRNIRLFLGVTKNSVNAGIRDTLGKKAGQRNFWAYNNGITIVCDNFKPNKDGTGVTLTNFSIVNGCQTTVSIAKSSKDAAQGVEVMARIIAASEQHVDPIIQYTNSQNKIRVWDFGSQDSLQKKLKKGLAEDPNPYLYVIRPGELRLLKKVEKTKYTRDGKLQVIKYDECAQFLGAFNGVPAIAYKDKGKLFTTYRENVFPKDIRVEQVLLAWRAAEAAEEIVREAIIEAVDVMNNEDLPILKRGAKMFVIAIMEHILRLRNGGTYLSKVKREVVTSKQTHKRLRCYAKVALVWYVEVVKDLLYTGSELSMLVRTQEAFPKIQAKVLSKWKVQSMSQQWVEEALPQL